MVRLNSKPIALMVSGPSAYVASRQTMPPRQAIALISDHGDPAAEIGKEEASGQTIYVRQVGEALAKLGWQVDMFTRKVHADDAAIVQHSPYCRTIRLHAGPEKFIPRDQVFDHLPEFVESFLQFQSKEGSNYPLIHTNYWMAGWVGLQLRQRSNIQLVHTYHSLGAVKHQALQQCPVTRSGAIGGSITGIRLAVEREILESAHCVVATSPQEEEALRQRISQQGRIEVIPCGTDISTFHAIPKAEARTALGLDMQETVILYVGCFEPRKGIETLVRAVAQMQEQEMTAAEGKPKGFSVSTPRPRLRLLLVGGSEPDQMDGQERERIEQLIQEARLAHCTTFAGLIGHDRLPLYYTAADVCVIPSLYEPFGLVAIEAMACGTPVVASDVGGLRFTVIPGETGLLVPPQDATAFAQAIARILEDEVWARKLRRQASLRVQQNFSWSGVAARLSHLYRHLLAQSISQESFWDSPLSEQQAVG